MYNSLQLDFTHSNIDVEYQSGGNIVLSYGDSSIEALMIIDSDVALQLVDKILALLDEKTTEELNAKIDELENTIEEQRAYIEDLLERLDYVRRKERYVPF